MSYWEEHLNIWKTALWLSVLDALLVLTTSASGIFLKGTYARETPAWAVQGMGQDIVNVVAVAVLFLCRLLGQQGIRHGIS